MQSEQTHQQETGLTGLLYLGLPLTCANRFREARRVRNMSVLISFSGSRAGPGSNWEAGACGAVLPGDPHPQAASLPPSALTLQTSCLGTPNSGVVDRAWEVPGVESRCPQSPLILARFEAGQTVSDFKRIR